MQNSRYLFGHLAEFDDFCQYFPPSFLAVFLDDPALCMHQYDLKVSSDKRVAEEAIVDDLKDNTDKDHEAIGALIFHFP